MARRFRYEILINGTNYDFTKIADSSTFRCLKPLCSVEKKSGNSTASVTIKGGANPTFYRNFMGILLDAQARKAKGDCKVTITDLSNNAVIFRGWLDMASLLISSKFFPDVLNLAMRGKETLLDATIRYNQTYEEQSRNAIVIDLLSKMNTDSGITPVTPYIDSELPDTEKIHRFCVTEAKNQTYREVIDRILFEAVGYVLFYDHSSDGFRIKEIPTTVDPLVDYRVVQYRVENSLVTQSEIYENDGILLSYPTVVERPNTNLFTANIGTQIDESGTIVGDQIPHGEYYPIDGDVKEIYQDFSMPDRAYISGESRLQNNDLKLIFAKNVAYEFASNPRMTLAPALPQVHWDGSAKIYPDRARVLFINNNVKTSNVTALSFTGIAVYVSGYNKTTVPDNCANPQEYVAETIQWMSDADDAKAKAFADWYYNTQRYGCTTSKWSEPEGYSTLGEIVMVRHKDTGVEMPHVIVQIEDQCAGGASGTIRLKEVIAVSLYGWQEVLSQTTPMTANKGRNIPRGAMWFNGTILTGTTTCRGVAGQDGDYYINDETGDIYTCIESGTFETALWKWVMNNKGKDATIDGYTHVVEYAISDSSSEFHFPDGSYGYETDKSYGAIDEDEDEFEYGFIDYNWSETIDNWVKGLYVWTRIRTTDSDGNVTYGNPTYAKDITDALVKACFFRLNPNTAEFIKNLACPNTEKDDYSATLQFNGFSEADAENPFYSFAVSSNGSDPSSISGISVSGGVLSFTLRRNTDATEIMIDVVGIHDESILTDPDATLAQKAKAIAGCIERASVVMTAHDITKFGVYAGVFANDADAEAYLIENYGGVYQGYSYIRCDVSNPDYSDIVIRYYGVDGQWNNLLISTNGAGQILSTCEKDFWSLYDNTSDENKEYLWNTYGYKKEIIAHAIATSKIVLYDASNGESGVISSANISTDVTQDLDANGKYLTKDGFRFEGKNGIIRAKSGFFSDIHIAGTSEFEGEIHSNSLETHNGNINTASYSGSNVGNTSHWSYDDLEDLLPATSDVDDLDVGSTYNGYSVTKYCHMVDLSKIYAGDSKNYNVSLTRYQFNSTSRSYTYTIAGNPSGGIVVSGLRPVGFNGSDYAFPQVTFYVDGVLKETLPVKRISTYDASDRGFSFTSNDVAVGSELKITIWNWFYTSTDGYILNESINFVVNPTVTYTDNINQFGLWLYDNTNLRWLLVPQASYQATPMLVKLGGSTVTNGYFTWENDCISDGLVVPAGALGSIDNVVVSKNGATIVGRTFVSVSWNENGITFTDSLGNFETIAKGSFYSGFSFSFDGQASESYTKVENLLPMRDDMTEIGSASHYFANAHLKNLDFNGDNVERMVIAFSYDDTDPDNKWWYRKWSDGFIEQGGLVNGTVTTGTDVSKSINTYTFSHAFTSKVLTILGKLAYPNFTGNFETNPPLTVINDVMPYNVTTTSFKPATLFGNGVYKQIDRPFYWYACGY